MWRLISRCFDPGSKRQQMIFVPDITDGAGKKYRKMLVDFSRDLRFALNKKFFRFVRI